MQVVDALGAAPLAVRTFSHLIMSLNPKSSAGIWPGCAGPGSSDRFRESWGKGGRAGQIGALNHVGDGRNARLCRPEGRSTVIWTRRSSLGAVGVLQMSWRDRASESKCELCSRPEDSRFSNRGSSGNGPGDPRSEAQPPGLSGSVRGDAKYIEQMGHCLV